MKYTAIFLLTLVAGSMAACSADWEAEADDIAMARGGIDLEADGTYAVPVITAPELADAASFDVSRVRFAVRRGEARLKYDLPQTLVGGTGANVDLRGALDASGAYVLSGAAGTATCTLASRALNCDERLDGVTMDAAGAKAATQLLGLGADLAARREQVIDRFASEPIGVLSAQF